MFHFITPFLRCCCLNIKHSARAGFFILVRPTCYMKESRLHYLFYVYFNKSATETEREELYVLLALSENDDQFKNLLTEAWDQFSGELKPKDDEQAEKILSGILLKVSQELPITMVTQRKSFTWSRVAAVVVTVLAFSAIFTWSKFKQPGLSIAGSKEFSGIKKELIVPGGNKAILTLSDGTSISLDSTRLGKLVKQGNAMVTNLQSSTLSYDTEKEDAGEVVYNTVSTSSGGQYQVILADGTKVWLNASSSIHFPTVFIGDERLVAVTGEAYFEVAKSAVKPFNVITGEVKVTVLGTHFNIMAYKDESTINTTLLEGSVKISKGAINKLLVPGKELRIGARGEMKTVEANIDEVMAWKNGWFQFDGYDIEKVMRQVSRWYNVAVVYGGEIPGGHFTGMVSRSNNIEQVLKIMEAGGVGFKIEGRKIVVYTVKHYSS